MCKIFTCVGFDNYKTLWKIAGFAGPIITRYDNDGFGMAGYSPESKKMWTEKFINPEDAWKIEKMEQGKLFRKTGKRNDNVSTLLTHARLKTSSKIIQNTHPFVRNNTALIHNGVVEKHGMKFHEGTCDSEGILTAYLSLNITHNPDNYKFLHETLLRGNGYFACCVLSKSNGSYCVDIFKSSSTQLYEVTVKNVKGFIYSTSIEYAKDAIKLAGYKLDDYFAVPNNTLLRRDATTGKMILEMKAATLSSKYDYSHTKYSTYYNTETSNRNYREYDSWMSENANSGVSQKKRKTTPITNSVKSRYSKIARELEDVHEIVKSVNNKELLN